MATVFVEKRKRDGFMSYIVRYKDPMTGSTVYHKSFRKMVDANQEAHDLRALIDSGRLPEKTIKFKALTFTQVAHSLKDEWRRRRDLGQLSEKTFSEYVIMANVVCRTFGTKIASAITKKELLDYQARRVVEFSNVTSNHSMLVIKLIMVHAESLNALRDNPAKSIKLLSVKAHQRNRFLMPHELVNLIKAAEKLSRPKYLKLAILLGAEHGASRQECLDLRWEDVDVDYQGVGLIKLFRTKNGHERTEFLMPRTRAAIIEWKWHLEYLRHRKKVEPVDGFVICRLNGTQIKRIDSAFKHACSLAKVKEFHFHDLRHTFCSNLILAGGDLKDAKEMIGHADLEMTDRYSHLTAAHKKLMQDRLASHYAEGVEQSGFHISSTRSKSKKRAGKPLR
jgi:integrase